MTRKHSQRKGKSATALLVENGFWHEICTQGHSRSFILQSIIAGLISNVSKEVVTQIAKNCHPVRQPHCEYPHTPIYFRKPESLNYIFAADSMGLSSFV